MTLTTVLAVLLLVQMVLRHLQEAAWRQERADLLQRIQAPELAVIQHDRPDVQDPRPVDLFDDEDHWASIERVQQMEREGL